MTPSGFEVNIFYYSCSQEKRSVPFLPSSAWSMAAHLSILNVSSWLVFSLQTQGPQWEWPPISRRHRGVGKLQRWHLGAAASPCGQYPISASKGISVLPLSQTPRGFWTLNLSRPGDPSKLPLPWESPNTWRFFVWLTTWGSAREWWGSQGLLHAEFGSCCKKRTAPFHKSQNFTSVNGDVSPLPTWHETLMCWVGRSPTGNMIPCERQKLPASRAGGQQVLEPFYLLGIGYPQKSKSWSCSRS